jgi:hypothetical protein
MQDAASQPPTAQSQTAETADPSALGPELLGPPAARPRWLLFCFAALTVVQWIAYRRSFLKLPAVDVWFEMIEIHRGNALGPWVFFTHSASNKAYRPLDSLLIWLFGNLIPSHPMWGIHFITLVMATFMVAVGTLWVRQLRLSKIGAIVAIGLLCLHPVLALSEGSVDGVDSVGSTALLWLAAYLILVVRSRAAMTTAVLLIFCIGGLLKEYIFALLPLAPCVIFCLRARQSPPWKDRSAWRDAQVLIGTLLAALAALMLVRHLAMEDSPSARGMQYVSLDPRDWAENCLRIFGGLLFIANTCWAYVNSDKDWAILLVAAWTVLLGFTLASGLVMRWLRLPRCPSKNAGAELTVPAELAVQEPVAPPDSLAVPTHGLERWLIFLALALCAAPWPAVIMGHISEMYLPPLVIPFALLAGLAADGLAAAAKPLRIAAILLGAAVAVSCLLSITWKVDDLVNVGFRADDQMKKLLALIPPDAHGWKILILIGYEQGMTDLSYGTMISGDELLLSQGNVLEWPRYGSGHTVNVQMAADPTVNTEGYDLIAIWDAKVRQFTYVQRSGQTAPPTTNNSSP